MYSENDFIQLSSLQHYVYCPRQCGLIHVEGVWSDNVYTVRGEILHEKVNTDTHETRGKLKTVRGLRIHSQRLGIVGRCDVVEFLDSKIEAGCVEVLPVEYKSGQPKEDVSDKVQLCAQALCLEEMMDIQIKRGAFFYGKIRHRIQVELDDELKKKTEEIINSVHDMVTRQKIPKASYSEKCKNCSLEAICLPKATNDRKLERYIKELYKP